MLFCDFNVITKSHQWFIGIFFAQVTPISKYPKILKLAKKIQSYKLGFAWLEIPWKICLDFSIGIFSKMNECGTLCTKREFLSTRVVDCSKKFRWISPNIKHIDGAYYHEKVQFWHSPLITKFSFMSWLYFRR